MPQPIKDALQAVGRYQETADPEAHPCEGSKFHTPRPLMVYPCRVGSKIMFLCGVCRDNVSIYLSIQVNSKPSWDVQRCFGNEIRRIADFILSSGNVE